MKKKYQVLIPDWLEDYIKYLAERYGMNFSEIIRAEICYAILCHVTHFYPDFKPSINPNEILGWLKNPSKEDLGKKEMHQVLSKIYFEARKAVEHRLEEARAADKRQSR